MLQAGDIAAISGPRDALVEQVEQLLPEVDDRELLDAPATVDRRVRDEQGRQRPDAARSSPTRRSRAGSTCARSRAT